MIFETVTLVEDPEPHPAAFNMALDEVLLRQGAGVLVRFYRWAQPAVSFGYFGGYREVLANWPSREAVRRWTGGGTVPHGRDFTYSVAVARSEAFLSVGTAQSYRLFHEAVALALGQGATLASEMSTAVSSECFQSPVPGDVLRGGVKVAGAAQRRSAAGLLHQGSVHGADEGFGERLLTHLSGKVDRRPLTAGEHQAAEFLADQRYGARTWLERR